MSIEKLHDLIRDELHGWRIRTDIGPWPIDDDAACEIADVIGPNVIDLIRTELTSNRIVEAVARTIAEESGDVTRYSTTAVDDHNRWSWLGDGHDVAFRDWFRDIARAALEAATTLGGDQ